jgi:hypothetical protein
LFKRDNGQSSGGRRVIEEFEASWREERRTFLSWLEHAYQEGGEPGTREQPYRFALATAMKGDCGREVPPDTLKRARSYLSAIEKRAEALQEARTALGI